MKEYENETTFPFKEIKRETPEHFRNVWVGFIQTFGTGLAMTVATWAVAKGMDFNPKTCLAWGGFAMIASTVFWFIKSPELIHTIETKTGFDINQDGHIGRPVTYCTYYTFDLSKTQQIRGMLGVEDTLVIDWCRAAIKGNSLAVNSWSSRFALPDGTEGKARYKTFQTHLINRKLAHPPRGNKSITLTPAGWIFAQAFAETELEEPIPLLEGEEVGSQSPRQLTHSHTEG